ncbi:MAG TPA: hypothetical protein PLE24_10225 [Chitinispirillaceae bacterium]|nr:hypothetical protein [Chitinispirillaceae bacterium]
MTWKNSISRIAILVISIAFSVSSSVLYTTVSNRELTVGDKILFKVSAIIPKGTTLTPPSHENSFGNIVIKDWNMHRTEREKSDSVTFEYVITTYTPENCTLPSLPFIHEQESRTDTLFSTSIPLKVISVLNTNDSIFELKDIKPQQSAGKAPLWWIWLLSGAAAIAAGVYLTKLLLKRLRREQVAPPPKPPYEEAIDALRALEAKQYLQKGLIREYTFELSEIFKRYIGRRYEINASDFTTEEMNAWVGISGLEVKLRRSVEWFFSTSDPVKFARQIPDDAVLERFGTEVREFLEATKPLGEKVEAGVGGQGK